VQTRHLRVEALVHARGQLVEAAVHGGRIQLRGKLLDGCLPGPGPGELRRFDGRGRWLDRASFASARRA